MNEKKNPTTKETFALAVQNHQKNPITKIAIAFFMIPKSYTLIYDESVHV